MDLLALKARMVAVGVERLYAKYLSPNDNSKNQIYLGGDFGIVNVLPAESPRATTTGKHQMPIFTAKLSLSWIDDDGAVHDAPGAQLILYPQYPEVRLSGFLRGASWSPASVMRSRDAGRVLLLGVGQRDRIFAFGAFRDHPVARALPHDNAIESIGVLKQLGLPNESGNSQDELLSSLCRISGLGWIEPWRLKRDGSRGPCRGTNCAGVTLESELGILANGRADPDFRGWEVKSHVVPNLDRPYTGVLTLLTPEPNGGFYGREGAEAFVRRYGYADLRGREDRLNFGGIHRIDRPADRTGLRLSLIGYDGKQKKLTDSLGALVMLDKTDSIAASWSFETLLAHWARKHAKAAYVPVQKRLDPSPSYYYGTRVTCALGTDYVRFLEALSGGKVYLDPGIKVERASERPKVKARNQFRVKFADLGYLYESVYELDACEGGE